jgi:hypothetical protein
VLCVGGRFAVDPPRIEPRARLADEHLPEWLIEEPAERGAAG